MVARAVHVAKVNLEKSKTLGGDAEGQKRWKPLIYKGFQVVVTVGLEPTVRMLNRRDCQPGRSLVSHEKATDEISATGGRRRLSLIDVNDVLWLCGRVYNKIMKLCSNR